jgi:branched-chain amino acid aminotransferase
LLVSITPTEYIWHNGRLVRWSDATVHVLAHGLHYGSAIFEGLRTYVTPRGPAIFRLADHMRRLFDSAKIYAIPMPYSIEQITAACREVIRANRLNGAYIRPIVYRGFGSFSLSPGTDVPVEAAVAAIEWGPYLGTKALEEGVDVCVSSWTRLAPNTVPIMAKAAGHYLSSQLIATEAARNGYAEGIALDASGTVSEGSGENVFVVKDGVILTPPLTASILPGITRDTVLTLARAIGAAVRECPLPRELLYVADEVCLTGTAAEITPVRSVDGIPVGSGRPGPVIRALQQAFFGLFTGETPDHWSWLDYVHDEGSEERPQNGALERVPSTECERIEGRPVAARVG